MRANSEMIAKCDRHANFVTLQGMKSGGILRLAVSNVKLSPSLILSDFMQSQRLITPAPQMANSITFLVVECRMAKAKRRERHVISTAA